MISSAVKRTIMFLKKDFICFPPKFTVMCKLPRKYWNVILVVCSSYFKLLHLEGKETTNRERRKAELLATKSKKATWTKNSYGKNIYH